MLWKKYDRQQIYQEYQRIYAIIFTDLNEEEDKNIKEIIEEKKYLKLIGPEKCSCSTEMNCSASNCFLKERETVI